MPSFYWFSFLYLYPLYTYVLPILTSPLYWYLPCTHLLPKLMSSLYWCPPYTDVLLKLMSFLFWCCPYTGVLPIIMSSLAKAWNFPDFLPSSTLTFHPSVSAKFCHSLNIPVAHFGVTKIPSAWFPQSLNHTAPVLSVLQSLSPQITQYYSLYLHSPLKSFGSPKNTLSYRLFIETATFMTFKSIKTFKLACNVASKLKRCGELYFTDMTFILMPLWCVWTIFFMRQRFVAMQCSFWLTLMLADFTVKL